RRGRDRRRLRQGGAGPDEARDVRPLRPGPRGEDGRDPARHPRSGRDGVEDQRGSRAGPVDPVHAAGVSGAVEHIWRRVGRDVNAAPALVCDPRLTGRRQGPDGAVLEFAGAWVSRHGLPEATAVLGELRSGGVRHLAFDTARIAAWDSGFVTYVLKVLA